MSKFDFRLQKVMEYRETLEQRAKEAYLDARAARLEGEVQAAGIESKRQAVLASGGSDLADLQAIETMMLKLDDDQRTQQAVNTILRDEEEKAMLEWTNRRQDLQALVKLREKALAEWELEQTRKEQAELDEWSVLRRKAA